MSDTNPLLAPFKLPGRIFQLPSRGIFYKNGELAENVKDGEIHVKAMSALDEITLKNPDQLFSGAAVNNVFPKCVDGVNAPSKLLGKDVDALMLFLRVVTYGPSYEFTVKHHCENAKEHNYVSDLEAIIANMKMLDPTTLEEQYNMKLPNGQKVKLRPNVYESIMSLIKKNQTKAALTVEDQQSNLRDMVCGVIESVDGITDRKMIEEWVSQLPQPLINRLGEKVEGIGDWGVDMIVEHRCKDCGELFKTEIAINPVTFFTE